MKKILLKVIKLGVDGVIVSNHGGRQLDAGQSSIVPMIHLVKKYQKEIKIMVDSGLRGGQILLEQWPVVQPSPLWEEVSCMGWEL